MSLSQELVELFFPTLYFICPAAKERNIATLQALLTKVYETICTHTLTTRS
jgi:hypothetical protein